MKKKIATIALVSLLAISTVFAGGLFGKTAKNGPDISVGARTGYKMTISFPENLDAYTGNNVPVLADAVFGITDNFAIGTGLGMNIAIPEKGDSQVSLATDVLAYYVLPLAKQFDLYLGGGLDFGYYSKSETVASIKSSASTTRLSMMLEARAVYEVVDHVEVFGALDFGVNMLNKGAINVAGKKTTADNPMGISWGINLGAAYKF